MTAPDIKTPLPGPRAADLIARDARHVSPSYTRDYPFVMSHGRGTEVWDVDGNRFLDFAAGIAVCSTGHAHPQVVARRIDKRERLGFPKVTAAMVEYLENEPVRILCPRRIPTSWCNATRVVASVRGDDPYGIVK